MGSVKKYCTRAMLIKDGEVAAIGDKESVADQYTLLNLEAEKKDNERKAQEMADKGEYVEGLNERCPLLRTYAVSPSMLTSDDVFEFAVEYQYDEPGDFYLAISMNDIRRGGITYDTGAKVFKMKRHGHHTVRFQVPLSLFNSGEFRLFTSLRTPSATDSNFTDMVAVATGDNACSFVIRNAKGDPYALLNHDHIRITPANGEENVTVMSEFDPFEG